MDHPICFMQMVRVNYPDRYLQSENPALDFFLPFFFSPKGLLFLVKYMSLLEIRTYEEEVHIPITEWCSIIKIYPMCTPWIKR